MTARSSCESWVGVFESVSIRPDDFEAGIERLVARIRERAAEQGEFIEIRVEVGVYGWAQPLEGA